MHRQRRFCLNIEKFSFWKIVPSCCFSKGKVICFFLSHFSPVFHFIWKPKRKTELKWVNVYILKCVATGGGRGPWPPYFNFQAKQGPTVSVSDIRDTALRVFRNYRDQKFHNFYRVCYNFWTIYTSFFIFSNYKEKQIISRWTFWKGPILSAGPSEKFLIVDHPKEGHNEQGLKR